MSDQLENLKPEDVSIGDRPLVDSGGAADPAAARHGPLSEFVHAARGRARELRPPDRRRDRQRQADRGVHAARRGRRGAGPGRSLPGRHGDAHPQDVQAARRQPAADRPGAGASDARRGRRRRSRTSAPGSAPATEGTNDADRLEIDALARNIKTNFQQVVSLSPLLSDDLQTLAMNITEPGRLADFIASILTDHQHRREAGGARDARHPRADGQPEPDSDQGARGPRARVEDPVAGAVRGRQEPARVLPARADEGDPEGARRRRRPDEGDRRARGEDRSRGDARGGQEGGAARARSAVEDAGRPPPNTRSRAPISTGSSRCRGASGPTK